MLDDMASVVVIVSEIVDVVVTVADVRVANDDENGAGFMASGRPQDGASTNALGSVAKMFTKPAPLIVTVHVVPRGTDDGVVAPTTAMLTVAAGL